LKNGRIVQIKKLQLEDKEKLVEMYAALSKEAVQWGMPPYTREILERWLGNMQNLIALAAFYGDRIVGHVQIYKLPHSRRKGTGDIVMYLHQDFHNIGLGTAMFKELLELAKKERMHRIGLHVIADNKRAIHLYEKFGFTIEGVMKEAYLGEDGKYPDELVMGLLLT
jgi:RimJ/RimL family protein N-acetyltransferase